MIYCVLMYLQPQCSLRRAKSNNSILRSRVPSDTAISNEHSSVGIEMAYVLDGHGSIPGTARNFSLLHSIQIGSGAHRATYPMGTGVTRLWREADHSPPSSAEVKNGGAIPPLPVRLHGVVLH
jgi:hypothetical protein